jgi:hypothetical protein
LGGEQIVNQNLRWPSQPRILEINTWPWLRELSERFTRRITLAELSYEFFPPEIKYFDAVWLLGVWTRSPAGKDLAQHLTPLHEECRRNLPDLALDDLVGSAFSIYEYSVEEFLGGTAGIEHVRDILHKHNKLLVLDFVPNHVGIDNPWLQTHPDWFLQGMSAELEGSSMNLKSFIRVAGKIFAHGRDPYFPPWIDTVQVKAFSQELRDEYVDILNRIANLCDGVRCDMAMLLTTPIVLKTWESRAGVPLEQEFWEFVLPKVKSSHPAFKFIAEVYWNLEKEMLRQGFDWCYDKGFYDRLLKEGPAVIRDYIRENVPYQKKLLRFVENHDEPRSLANFGLQRAKAAGLLTLTVPGAKLVYEGQFQGNLLTVPVQLGRRQVEHPIPEIVAFYKDLLPFLSEHLLDEGRWQLLQVIVKKDMSAVSGPWHHAQVFAESRNDFIGYLWGFPSHFLLVLVNYSASLAQGVIAWPIQAKIEGDSNQVEIFDLFGNRTSTRSRYQLESQGIEVALSPWGMWVLKIRPGLGLDENL